MGEEINLGFDQVIVERSVGFAEEQILVKFENKEGTSNNLRQKLKISTKEGSSIVELSITDEILRRGQNILNQLIDEYNKDAIEDNNLIAKNTSDFINERLDSINYELDSIELDIENFVVNTIRQLKVERAKLNRQLTNVTHALAKIEGAIQMAPMTFPCSKAFFAKFRAIRSLSRRF